MDRVSASLGGDRIAMADSCAGAAAMMNPTDAKKNARRPRETPRRKREVEGAGAAEIADAGGGSNRSAASLVRTNGNICETPIPAGEEKRRAGVARSVRGVVKARQRATDNECRGGIINVLGGEVGRPGR